jgi:hypothetical protein
MFILPEESVTTLHNILALIAYLHGIRGTGTNGKTENVIVLLMQHYFK